MSSATSSCLFDKYVSLAVAGSFYRKEKGTALEEIRADFDVNDEDEALAYVEKIIAYLERDMRSAQQTPTGVASQLRKNVDVKALYDYLWVSAIWEPEYSLKLDGKDLSHLSPGERGTLLLVFYLLVDKSNKPNHRRSAGREFDSQTVYLLLIPSYVTGPDPAGDHRRQAQAPTLRWSVTLNRSSTPISTARPAMRSSTRWAPSSDRPSTASSSMCWKAHGPPSTIATPSISFRKAGAMAKRERFPRGSTNTVRSATARSTR